ncbi:MAG: glucan biosynthesis glucosyltransferase H, partial [Acetomicrobium sp.]
VWTSRPTAGETFKGWGLFLTPQETNPSLEIRILEEVLYDPPILSDKGLCAALFDPWVNALHRGLMRKKRSISRDVKAEIETKVLGGDHESLTKDEAMKLLRSPALLFELHKRIWESPKDVFDKWETYLNILNQPL